LFSFFDPFGEQASRLPIDHHEAVEGFLGLPNVRAISTSFEGTKWDEAAILIVVANWRATDFCGLHVIGHPGIIHRAC
jgi:hypothetical protein